MGLRRAMDDDDRLLMCAENVREGMALGPIFYVLSAEQMERFAGALRSRNPLFVAADPAARVAPPSMRLQDYALLIAHHFHGGSGGVHAKHWCEFHQPLRAGLAVRVDGKITRTYRKRGKFYFDLQYESRDAASFELLTRQSITSVLLKDGEMR